MTNIWCQSSGVLLDLILTGLTVQFAQAFLMGQQFSTDFLATVGPIFMQLFYYAHSLFWSFLAYFGHFWPIMAKKCFVFLREIFLFEGKSCKDWSAPPGAHLNQKLTLARTYNLILIHPDKKDLSGKPKKICLSGF